jgi:hypothetical protein
MVNCLSLTYCNRFQQLAADFTIGREVVADSYHVGVVRGPLTRNIGTLFSELHEEIELQFASEIPPTKGRFSSTKVSNNSHIIHAEWVSKPALQTVMQIVSGTSNRLFVGLPLCKWPFGV